MANPKKQHHYVIKKVRESSTSTIPMMIDTTKLIRLQKAKNVKCSELEKLKGAKFNTFTFSEF